MSRITFFALTAAAVTLGCAGSSRWVKLDTRYGEFAVDTVRTNIIGDGMVETWIKEIDRDNRYTYFLPVRAESDTRIEIDCFNLLMRAKRADYWMDHRRVGTVIVPPSDQLWSDLSDPVDYEDVRYNRADFLYTHACMGRAAAGFVTVDNRNSQSAVVSLYYRGLRVPVGVVPSDASQTMRFSCPLENFQFIIELVGSQVEESGRTPEPVPCHLTEQFYAQPGDTVSFLISEDLDQQTPRDVCPRPR